MFSSKHIDIIQVPIFMYSIKPFFGTRPDQANDKNRLPLYVLHSSPFGLLESGDALFMPLHLFFSHTCDTKRASRDSRGSIGDKGTTRYATLSFSLASCIRYANHTLLHFHQKLMITVVYMVLWLIFMYSEGGFLLLHSFCNSDRIPCTV